eukprot:TRINITY_DN16889_c0_g1_i1.p1 TRINITY_DN16889_c0_g1~~TRINITY_DN16889_c0_g1_i1.p1  ORF type:complete len:336 (-),score=93.48 TRINITY_DN16889_c0_g1_i1:360-1367(-)
MVNTGSMEQSSSPGSSSSSSKKIKKKQSKEVRDKQKQAEKKKRRLEKAVANATALRIELEKKKQKRKEEEQRLYEEGAALAEAVALHVLVEEDKEDLQNHSNISDSEKSSDIKNSAVLSNDDFLQATDIQKIDQNSISSRKMNYEHHLDALLHSNLSREKSDLCDEEYYEDENSMCNDSERNIENIEVSSKRVTDAELAAGLDVASAVTNLKIAEEAKEESDTTRMAAETVFKGLESPKVLHLDDHVPNHLQPNKTVEEERDELKIQVLEMKHTLQEKTKRIIQLEQDLECLRKQYIMQCNYIKLISSTSYFESSITREQETSNITGAKSSDLFW